MERQNSSSAMGRRREDAQRAYERAYRQHVRAGKGEAFARGKAKHAYGKVMSAPMTMAERLEEARLEQFSGDTTGTS